jgi:hypothetical protein
MLFIATGKVVWAFKPAAGRYFRNAFIRIDKQRVRHPQAEVPQILHGTLFRNGFKCTAKIGLAYIAELCEVVDSQIPGIVVFDASERRFNH